MAKVSTKRSKKRVVKSSGKRAVRSVRTSAATRAEQKRPAASRTAATAIREPYTKAQLLATLAENTGVEKKDVAAVLTELNSVIERHIKKRAAGQFTLPGLMKIRTTRKPATRARKGRNPLTGDEIMIKAKPAHTVVKISSTFVPTRWPGERHFVESASSSAFWSRSAMHFSRPHAQVEMTHQPVRVDRRRHC